MTHATTSEMERRQVQIGASTVYFQSTGAGRPVVLLHGLSGSTRWWVHNVSALSEHFRVQVIDLVGFGHSRRGRFVLHQAAQLLVQWMDELGLERASFVGHSMGGFIAADLAAHYPERVDRLVLVDAAAVPFSAGYVRDTLGLVRALRYMPINFLPVLLSDALRAGLVTLLKAIREILSTDISAELARIQAPTLVLWGEHDTVIPVKIGRKLHQQLPQARFLIIDGAGHNPMWDRPEPFNRAVIDFLK